jgi:hypothetical protein
LELWLLVVVILHLAQVLAASFVVLFNIFQSLPLLSDVYHSHGLAYSTVGLACRFKLVRNHFSHGYFFTSNALKALALLVGDPRIFSRVALDASDAFVPSMVAFYDKKLDQKYEKMINSQLRALSPK